MRLVDSHSHFDVEEFDGNRVEAYHRALAAGVDRQIVPAIDATCWPKLKHVCNQFSGLHPAYGLHPIFLDVHRPEHLDELTSWIERERPVAVGECGLDYFVDGLDRDTQQYFFDAQLQLAREFDLPVIVHARRAVDAVIHSIKRIGGLRGVIHSFPGSTQQAAQLHALGFLVGIGGPVTYERAKRMRSVVASLPIEQLLLETDSPDQPDAAHRGQRNEPARLPVILQAIATLRGIDADALAIATTRNAERLFGLPEIPQHLQ
ncbi:MAG: TatD family hydrolase [Thermomonas sp.]